MKIEPADGAMFRERDAWRYDPPYDFYDSDGLPVKNPKLFFAVRDDGALIGFYFFEPCGDALFYGLGLRPDLTGRGLGEQFVLAGLEFASTIHGRRRVVLDVAAFNERAARLYLRLGFTDTGRHTETFDDYGVVDFIGMEKPARTPAARSRVDAGAVRRGRPGGSFTPDM
ncbi:GNAT family N-acetyltransferase [Frankia gtarii]|uniref:GNAT family N-acetyltransferase n=1 Tax=Frankia gtarii TaxID=2950102 RepID=UPI0021BFFE7F|nr:GNAT family N-acetyltransferase [Frankia gtarii]